MLARPPAFARWISARRAVVLVLVLLLAGAVAALEGGTPRATTAFERAGRVSDYPGLTHAAVDALDVVNATAGDARRASTAAPLFVAVLPFLVVLAMSARPRAVPNLGTHGAARGASRGRARRRAPPAVRILP